MYEFKGLYDTKIKMHLINSNSKIFHKISSFLGVKTLLNVGLAMFWALIIFGTFKEFI